MLDPTALRLALLRERCMVVTQTNEQAFDLARRLARRVVLVGDPGQIPPVVACAVERWRGNPAGPHVACPKALLTRHPDVPRLALPVSRRLVPDTVRLVQVARAGIEALLLRYAPSGDRVLGLPGDPEFEGWRAHLSVLQRLRGDDRTVTLP
jgi:hypothetical protein